MIGPAEVRIRPTRHADIPALVALSAREYGETAAWKPAQLASHLDVFPEGQLVAVADDGTGECVVGMAASLVIFWDDYDLTGPWRDFTARGYFTNHDPAHGRTLYGAEIITDPAWRGRGVASALYEARCALVRRLGLLRIRAGARLVGYHRVADAMSPEEYVVRVVRGELRDDTLSFQLHRGFQVIGVVSGYLALDERSRGCAAIIEWLNEAVATPADREAQRRWAARCLGR